MSLANILLSSLCAIGLSQAASIEQFYNRAASDHRARGKAVLSNMVNSFEGKMKSMTDQLRNSPASQNVHILRSYDEGACEDRLCATSKEIMACDYMWGCMTAADQSCITAYHSEFCLAPLMRTTKRSVTKHMKRLPIFYMTLHNF